MQLLLVAEVELPGRLAGSEDAAHFLLGRSGLQARGAGPLCLGSCGTYGILPLGASAPAPTLRLGILPSGRRRPSAHCPASSCERRLRLDADPGHPV